MLDDEIVKIVQRSTAAVLGDLLPALVEEYGRETFHFFLVAQLLVGVQRAVDFHYINAWLGGKLVPQAVPSRRETFAVAAPRGIELDKRYPALDTVFEIVPCEFAHGARSFAALIPLLLTLLF